ncbi:hypothetical protein [Bradyrhizobium sp.]|uniref:hypothetical protein n=1 Tax=Bradyrhizobium sp. TaxID=376 RepID=UPI003BAE9F7F
MKETPCPKSPPPSGSQRGWQKGFLRLATNPQWTEYELQTIDEWIARHGVKLDRSEAIRRLVEIRLKAKGK